MRTDIHVWWALFLVTNTLMLILLCTALKQCCNSNISDKTRCHRTVCVVLFSISALILNTFSYLTSLYYPRYTLLFHEMKIPIYTFIFEALSTMIGFRIFCLFHQSMLHGLYKTVSCNLDDVMPLWINCTFYLLQVVVLIMAVICYSFVFIFHQFYSLITFYILYAVIILCQSLFVMFESNKILKLLNIQSPSMHSRSMHMSLRQQHTNNNTRTSNSKTSAGHSRVRSWSDSPKLLTAKRTMRTAICVLLLICMACLGDIVINLEVIENGVHSPKEYEFDILLWGNIVRSSLTMTLMMMVNFWIYRRDVGCCDCRGDDDSVWMCIWRCTDYKHWLSVDDDAVAVTVGKAAVQSARGDEQAEHKHQGSGNQEDERDANLLLGTPYSLSYAQPTNSNANTMLVFEETTTNVSSVAVFRSPETDESVAENSLLIAGDSVK